MIVAAHRDSGPLPVVAEDLPAAEGIRTRAGLAVVAASTAEAVESNLGPVGKPDVLAKKNFFRSVQEFFEKIQ